MRISQIAVLVSLHAALIPSIAGQASSQLPGTSGTPQVPSSQPQYPLTQTVPSPVSTQPVNNTPATMKGNVTDPEGAVVPGATITLTPAKGKPVTGQSTPDGSYVITNVPTGTYSVTITMPGFASAVRTGVKFTTGQTLTMSVKLAIEEQNTEVTVTSTANQVSVDADSNASSLVIKDKDLDALSDDPDELSSQLSALAGPSAGPNGGQIYVDGFTGGQLPPKSSIREIRINQNPFSAQYDKPGFGRVEILTKPGSDAYHGQAFIMGNQSALNTSSPFLGAANSFPAYYSIFGMGSFSGPLTKKSSFSTNGSYRDQEENATISGSIVSRSATDATPCAPGDTTCALYAYPVAFRSVPNPKKRYDFSPRLDFAVSDKNTLTVRYQYEGGSSQSNGIGTYTLPSAGTNATTNEQTLSISDSQIFSSKVVNETRFQYRRNRDTSVALTTTPSLTVQSTFTTGGSSSGSSSTHGEHLEVQNYASVSLAKNFIRFGGRWRYDSSALYSNAGSNGRFTYGSVADYIANKPLQYAYTQINNFRSNGNTMDVGLYAEDDWKIKQNLTLSYGLRYETQTVIHSNRDFAPRVSVAYGIPRKSGQPVTVIRAGFGIFYDRFDLSNILTTYRQNGINQVQYTYDTSSLPAGQCTPSSANPATSCGTGASVRPTIYTLGSLRSEYNMQFALGFDQQITKTATASFNFISANGVHAYLSRSIAPTATQLQYQFQSGGVYHQNEFMTNVRWNPSRAVSVAGYYVYTHSQSNTNGATNFPTNSTNPRVDYGRAAFSQANRMFLFGNFSLPFSINASPLLFATSGTPYNVTTGVDNNGDSVYNDRAYFQPGRTSANCSNFSDFAASGANSDMLPSNYCTGPANFRMDLRLSKAFGFGQKRGVADAQSGRGGGQNGPPGGGNRGGGGGGNRGGGGGGPMMFGGGGGAANHRYNFTLGAQASNLFNVVPYGQPVGSLSNPSQFGKSVQLNSGFGGTSSAVRRFNLQLSFNF